MSSNGWSALISRYLYKHKFKRVAFNQPLTQGPEVFLIHLPSLRFIKLIYQDIKILRFSSYKNDNLQQFSENN